MGWVEEDTLKLRPWMIINWLTLFILRLCFFSFLNVCLFLCPCTPRTRETLASGHFMSVINILMQLRKVCNHPNLFDPRPIHSPFITKAIIYSTASLVQRALETSPFEVNGRRPAITKPSLSSNFACLSIIGVSCPASGGPMSC